MKDINNMDKHKNPFVSVIIPVYNDPVRLKICLYALEEQTYPKDSYEVIVVDNGSDESIEPIVSEYAQAQTCSEARQGSFAARNTGIALAQGEILAFTDSDCIPASDWIERGVSRLASVPNCGLVGGKVELFFHVPNRPNPAELYDSLFHLNQKDYIEKKNFSATANVFTFKQVFEHVGVFAGNLYSIDDSDDKEWGQRVASCGYTLVYGQDVLVTHPTRHSFGQLRQKLKRVAKGAETVNKQQNQTSWRQIGQEIFIGLIPPVFTTRRFGRQYNWTLLEQVEFLAIWVTLHYIRIYEQLKVRLLSGG